MGKSINDLMRERIRAKNDADAQASAAVQRAENLVSGAAEQLVALLKRALEAEASFSEINVVHEEPGHTDKIAWTSVRAVALSELVRVELETGIAWQVSHGIQLGFGNALPLRGRVFPIATGSALKGPAEFEYEFANPVMIAPPHLGITR